MRILLLGSGGREHALARALSTQPANPDQTVEADSQPGNSTEQPSDPAGQVHAAAGVEKHKLYCAPANPGIERVAEKIELDAQDGDEVANWASKNLIDLVVIGPEAPLVAGVANAVRAAAIPVFGPDREAAELEGSKAFAKEIMRAAGVDTAAATTCTTISEVEAAMEEYGAPYVIKNDGLAAGKGVVVTDEAKVAREHAAQCLEAEGGKVLVEEYLDGEEVSLFCLSDGDTVVPLAPAQDFKRAYDGDAGPNTGGMGAYSPLPWLEENFTNEVVEKVALPVVKEMKKRGTPFVGLLYCGLACTSKGVRVVEFNARFGDPETQPVLARLRTPLAPVLLRAATGKLAQQPALQWDERSAVGVVLAAEGYPGPVVEHRPVSGWEEADKDEDVHVLVAGMKPHPYGDGQLITSGGRVLTVVGLGKDLGQARRRAYSAMEKIKLEGGHYRSDIAGRVSAETR